MKSVKAGQNDEGLFNDLLDYSVKIDFSRLSESLRQNHTTLKSHELSLSNFTDSLQSLKNDKESGEKKIGGLQQKLEEHNVSPESNRIAFIEKSPRKDAKTRDRPRSTGKGKTRTRGTAESD